MVKFEPTMQHWILCCKRSKVITSNVKETTLSIPLKEPNLLQNSYKNGKTSEIQLRLHAQNIK